MWFFFNFRTFISIRFKVRTNRLPTFVGGSRCRMGIYTDFYNFIYNWTSAIHKAKTDWTRRRNVNMFVSIWTYYNDTYYSCCPQIYFKVPPKSLICSQICTAPNLLFCPKNLLVLYFKTAHNVNLILLRKFFYFSHKIFFFLLLQM